MRSEGGERLAEFKRGITAGAKAGVIFGIIIAILGIAYTYATLEPGEYIIVERAIGLVIGYAIGGAIIGVIFGAIYAAAYGHLPGAKSIPKGISLGIVWWIVVGIGLAYLQEAIDPYHIVTSLISALIWGSLIGFFWERYKPRPIKK